MTDVPSDAAEPRDDVTADGVFHAVRDGYEAVYDALARGETFGRIWRETAYHSEFPVEFAHIGFLTLTEAQRMLAALELGAGQVLVDLACGAGGPGLWAAQQSGASLVGIDPAPAGLAAARQRARAVGLDDRARFDQGTFQRTGLPDRTADAAMTVDALQYAPDKRAAINEFFRILSPARASRSCASRSTRSASKVSRCSASIPSPTTHRCSKRVASPSTSTRRHRDGATVSIRRSMLSLTPATL